MKIYKLRVDYELKHLATIYLFPLKLVEFISNGRGFMSVCFLPLKNKKDKKQIALKPVLAVSLK